MKILQLCHKSPLPTIDGGCIAIHNITKCLLESGMDVYTAVPILAAYVGHVNYMDTEKYIHFTEQGHEDFVQKESSLGSLFPEVGNE